MSLYTVTAKGCDDNTRVEIELTDTEAAAVRKVAEAVTAASSYSCEPRLYMSDTTKDVVRIVRSLDGLWHWERKTANGQCNGQSHRGWASRKDAENNARKVNAAPAGFKVVE